MPNNFAADPRCKALWSLENGALLADSIGTNTLTASASSPVADVGDFKEKAACGDFDKANYQYLTIADASLAAGFPLKDGDTTKKITICCWIKPETLNTQQAIVGKLGYSGSLTAGLRLFNDTLYFQYNADRSTGITLTAGVWYHIALVIDGIAKTVYVRVFQASDSQVFTYSYSSASALTISATPWRIGGYTDYAGLTFDGKIDEVAVFNDLLSATEIDLIRVGDFGLLHLAGTIAGVASVQGNISGVSTLLEGTVAAVSSITGGLTGGSLDLGFANCDAVSGTTADLTSVVGPVPTVIVSTGGWALGGAGVWVSTLPTSTIIPADAEPTGFYLGGEGEFISTTPAADVIVDEVVFKFCGPGATGNAVTSEPAQDVIEADGGFVMGGAGVWGQVAPGGIPSTVLVGSGGWILSGSGFTLAPGVTPPTTVIVSTGGWVLGRSGLPPIEVTYPTSLDRVIEETVAFEFGGAGPWGGSIPGTTVIISQGAIFVLSGSGGLATVKSPPIAVITGDATGGFVSGATGGFVLGGSGWAVGVNDEVFEAWVLSGQAFEPSVWSAFNFNSFAVKGGQAYACGDAGIYLLGADHDAGEQIHSGCRVGPVNLGSDRDKRFRGIQFGQGGKNTRVRVASDEGNVGVFTPDRDENRVVVSRDIQGREFTIDIMDFEELSQCEIMPLRLARR